MNDLKSWNSLRIKELFLSSIPGDWGTESTPEHGIPVLRSTNFCNDGSINFTDLAFRKINSERLLKRLVDKDTILIEKSGGSPTQPAGRVVFCNKDFKGTASNFIEIVKIKEEFSPKFVSFLLYHLYKSGLVHKYQQQTTGIINFKLGEYSEELVLLPKSKSEQSKIAEVLSKVDEAIGHTESLIAKQERIKIGLMQDLLTRGIDEQGNLRSEETHKFKDSALGRIPIEWEYSLLDKSCNVHNNLRKPISSMERENIAGSYPYYGPTGVIDHINEYRVVGRFVLIGEDGDHFLKYSNQEMTLLIEGKNNVNNHAHILSGNEKVITDWLHLFFMHRDITFYLTRQGAGRFKLNKATLLTLPIIYPLLKEEQNRIVAIINKYRKTQKILNCKLNKLCSLKSALMQDLLSAKVRVTPLLEKTADSSTLTHKTGDSK